MKGKGKNRRNKETDEMNRLCLWANNNEILAGVPANFMDKEKILFQTQVINSFPFY